MAKRQLGVVPIKQLLSGQNSGGEQLSNDKSVSLATIAAKARRNQAIEQRIRFALGDPLADHVWLGDVSPQRLLLVTDSPVWSNRVRYQARALLASLADYFDSRQTPRLEVKIVPTDPGPARRDRIKPEISQAAAAHLEEAANAAEPGSELQRVLARLASRKRQRSTD